MENTLKNRAIAPDVSDWNISAGSGQNTPDSSPGPTPETSPKPRRAKGGDKAPDRDAGGKRKRSVRLCPECEDILCAADANGVTPSETVRRALLNYGKLHDNGRDIHPVVTKSVNRPVKKRAPSSSDEGGSNSDNGVVVGLVTLGAAAVGAFCLLTRGK